jgi:hypothetical protein
MKHRSFNGIVQFLILWWKYGGVGEKEAINETPKEL